MSKSESPADVGETYDECTPCGYTASAVAIGLCPVCGDRLAETSRAA